MIQSAAVVLYVALAILFLSIVVALPLILLQVTAVVGFIAAVILAIATAISIPRR